MNELPAEPVLSGVLWTWIVPGLVFAVALAATWFLYRHFSSQTNEDDS
jgi:hypothetical protein